MIILRIIILIIIFLIFYIPYIYLNFNSWWIKLMSSIFLKVANIADIKINNLKTFKKYLNSDKKLLIVSNHKSLFDIFILLNSLNDIGFMLSKTGGSYLPFINQISVKSNSFFYKNGEGTKTLMQKIKSRKMNDNIIVVFADSMDPILPGYNIAPFKNGAFTGKFDILPVIIKYTNYVIDPTFRWYNGESPIVGCCKVLLDGKCRAIVDIMDLVSCKEDMSIEQYKNYVHNLMNTRYNDL